MTQTRDIEENPIEEASPEEAPKGPMRERAQAAYENTKAKAVEKKDAAKGFV